MQNPSSTLVALERQFWQSMVDHKTDVTLSLLCEPAIIGWRCAMHTEAMQAEPVPDRKAWSDIKIFNTSGEPK